MDIVHGREDIILHWILLFERFTYSDPSNITALLNHILDYCLPGHQVVSDEPNEGKHGCV